MFQVIRINYEFFIVRANRLHQKPSQQDIFRSPRKESSMRLILWTIIVSNNDTNTATQSVFSFYPLSFVEWKRDSLKGQKKLCTLIPPWNATKDKFYNVVLALFFLNGV